MTHRTESLVDQFLQIHNEFVNIVAGLSPEEWQRVPAGEERPVGVIAYHTAAGYPITLGFAQMLARGESFPAIEAAAGHQMNAQQAAEHAGVGKEEVLALLENNCAGMLDGLRGFNDEQLDMSGTLFGYTMTTQIAIQGIVFGHLQEHLTSIKSAAG